MSSEPRPRRMRTRLLSSPYMLPRPDSHLVLLTDHPFPWFLCCITRSRSANSMTRNQRLSATWCNSFQTNRRSVDTLLHLFGWTSPSFWNIKRAGKSLPVPQGCFCLSAAAYLLCLDPIYSILITNKGDCSLIGNSGNETDGMHLSAESRVELEPDQREQDLFWKLTVNSWPSVH